MHLIEDFLNAEDSVAIDVSVDLAKLHIFNDVRVWVSECPTQNEILRLKEFISLKEHNIKIIDLSKVKSSHIGKVIQMLANAKVSILKFKYYLIWFKINKIFLDFRIINETYLYYHIFNSQKYRAITLKISKKSTMSLST